MSPLHHFGCPYDHDERIASLEAENARLKRFERVEPECVELRRERDEARAACAVKDEALRDAIGALETIRGAKSPHTFVCASVRLGAPICDCASAVASITLEDEPTLAAAISSTAGPELLARVETAESANRGHLLRLEDLQARLEKAEAERREQVRAWDVLLEQFRGEREGMQAQLEQMRAALERLEQLWRFSRPHWAPGFKNGEEALKQAQAALLPSAPRSRKQAEEWLAGDRSASGALAWHGNAEFEARICADEREACAKLAEDFQNEARDDMHDDAVICIYIAAAIRARGSK